MKRRQLSLILLVAALLAGTAAQAGDLDPSSMADPSPRSPEDLIDRIDLIDNGVNPVNKVPLQTYRSHQPRGVIRRPGVGPSRLSAEELYPLLHEANAAFQQANAAGEGLPNAKKGVGSPDPGLARQSYDKAILLYERIIEAGGVRNAGLYYNLANAYLLKEDLGRAILNYRRAERLDNSDLNIKKNLAFARSRRIDRVEVAAPKRVLETLFFWHYDLSLQTRFLLACLAFAALCISVTVMIWRGRGTASAAGAVLSGVLALSLLSSLGIEAHRQTVVRHGVITAAEVVARQGDGPNYPPSFKDPLHAGTEFELLEQRPGWFHLRLSDGTDTWIPDDTAGLV